MARVNGGLRNTALGLAGLLCLHLVGPGPVAAQDSPGVPVGPNRGIVGVFMGKTSSRQIWTPPFASARLEGLTFGLFVDVQTPIPFLSVRAEGGYVGRGTVVWDQAQDPARAAEAKVRSHYLTLPIHGKAAVGWGPLAGYVFAGPTVDILISSECSSQFCQVVRGERGMVVNVAVGLGFGLEWPGGFRSDMEARITEGLSEAYLGDRDSARNRSVELLVRLGKPL
ncbi:outer membrane beta-barrel protein [Gemmatimonadota bacterium]